MRKTVLFLMIAFSFQLANAKTPVGTYRLSYYDKDFVVEAGNLENGSYDIYFEVKAVRSKYMRILIGSGDLDVFKSALIETRDKYVEWNEVAETNNVQSVDKPMGIDMPKVTVFWDNPSSSHYNINQELHPIFSVQEDGTCLMAIVNEVTSSTNKYIKETFYWFFSSVKEIDDLLALLEEDKLIKAAGREQNLQELFN